MSLRPTRSGRTARQGSLTMAVAAARTAATAGYLAACRCLARFLVASLAVSPPPVPPLRGRRIRPRSRPSPAGRGEAGKSGEAGMSTAEYAIGTLAACTFAALLIAIIRSPAIRSTLTGLITSALQLGR